MNKKDWYERGREDYVSERAGKGHPKGEPPREGTWQRKAWDEGWNAKREELATQGMQSLDRPKRGWPRKMEAMVTRLMARRRLQLMA